MPHPNPIPSPDDSGWTVADREAPIRRYEELPPRTRFVEKSAPVGPSAPSPKPGHLTRSAPGGFRR